MKIQDITAGFLLCFLASWPALAHGPAPTSLGVGAYDESGQVTVVRTSRGLAMAQDNHWQFVCPSVWAGPDTPLVGTHMGSTTPWIVGSPGLSQLHADGSNVLIPTDSPVTAANGRAMSHLKNSTLVLAGFSPPSRVWRLENDEAALLWESETVWSTMTVLNEQVFLGRTDNGVLTLAWFSADDISIETQTFESDPIQSPELRVADGRLFVRTFIDEQFSLSEIHVQDATIVPIVTSKKPIHGPIGGLDDNPLIIVTEHSLTLLDQGVLTTTSEEARVTCLHQTVEGAMIACVYPDLYEVTPVGMVGNAIFQLKQLGPPRTEGLATEQRKTCELEWMDLTADAGLNPAGPAISAPKSSSSCAMGQSTMASMWVILMALAFLVMVRRFTRFTERFQRP